MLGIPSLFTFFHEIELPDFSGRRAFVFAYRPPGAPLQGAVEELLDAVRKSPKIPDAIVLLEVHGASEVANASTSEALKIAKSRLEGQTALLHVTIVMMTGKVICRSLDTISKIKSRPYVKYVSKFPDKWLNAGLNELFDPSAVILKAPPGYAYQKPSGAKEKFFLKPDLAFKTSSSVSYVALCIFRQVFAGRPDKVRDLQTVYLDTMAIAPVAYAIRELRQLSGQGEGPFLVESFHSYDGMTKVKRPLRGTSLCLISASTSLSMHEQWIKEKGVAEDEVLTLVSIQPINRYAESVLHACKLPDGLSSEGPPQLSIRLTGELFLPEQELPKKVLLREPVHGRHELMKFLSSQAGELLFDIYRPAALGMPVRRRAVFVDGRRLLMLNEFKQWLSIRLIRKVRASTRVIVYQDDEASYALAKHVCGCCVEELEIKEPRLVSSTQLVDAKLPKDGGVIICAAVAGRGAQLLNISRVLRDKNVGSRFYLIGFRVCETASEVNGLALNLEHDKFVKHDVEVFKQLWIGNPLLKSFTSEIEEFYPRNLLHTSIPELFRHRASKLTRGAALHDLVLLPSATGRPMALRSGFAYWPSDGYSPGPWQAEVLCTVGLMLQRARENTALGEENRLSSSGFRHVLLDPENFSRYNDGVIQSALLRCAYPSELDYRADLASSAFMGTLIVRGLERLDDEAGEASFEFLLALALRKLQLAQEDLDEVLCRANQLQAPRKVQSAIRFLIGPLVPSAARSRKSIDNVPF